MEDEGKRYVNKKHLDKIKNLLFCILIVIICAVIFVFQTKKVGFHEDEVYTLSSSVSPINGLLTGTEDNRPEWRTKEYVQDYMKLTPNNYLNLASIYKNQEMDNHPPFFYTLVHFSSMLFSGNFSKYTVFVVNIISFVITLIVIKKILKLINKENLTFPLMIFYGLSMGTISMVLYQRMYMLLTLFILIYFYLNLRIYKNDFKTDKKMKIKLGITTVLGFLTQYFFAIYAIFVFAIMIIQMIRKGKKDQIKDYVIPHIIYAVIGVLLFPPCIKHLLFSDRGIKNIGNANYFTNLIIYLKQLAYAFSVNYNMIVMGIVLLLFAIFTIITYIKDKKDRFIISLTIIPSIFFFIITVKLTSFQELRYIMPILPFMAIMLFLIFDKVIKIKYKDAIIFIISIILITIGFIYSKPKFLYEDYKEYIDMAKSNKDKSFVYVYDNFFNHMQSIPEMMIYNKSLIVNVNNDELKYLINDENLKNEDSFILSIKAYMNNEDIINEIRENTDFKEIKNIYKGSQNEIGNNLYLVSK